MDIVVKGRHAEIPERFRQQVAEKLAKIEKLDPKVITVDVELSKERNPRQSDLCERVELTVYSRGPVVRAEAAAQDCYAALDSAYQKLEARLRRSHDRRRVHHGNKTPVSVATATAGLESWASAALASRDSQETLLGDSDSDGDGDGTGPMVIREKTHDAKAISIDQALYEMELVGHDFYLFIDADSAQPAVVYRRHAYDYGVIRLEG
ncbi:MAG: ribosome-associated translation inhibitor RaiA [Sporichthyaceae bacterium]